MKINILLFVFSLVFIYACNNEEKQHLSEEIVLPNLEEEDIPLADLKFENVYKNIGSIKDTGVVKVDFNFKNVSDNPAILKQVLPSCKCTVVKYDKDTIYPKEESKITFEFKPSKVEKGQIDFQGSKVVLKGNFKQNVIKLKIDAMVEHFE